MHITIINSYIVVIIIILAITMRTLLSPGRAVDKSN